MKCLPGVTSHQLENVETAHRQKWLLLNVFAYGNLEDYRGAWGDESIHEEIYAHVYECIPAIFTWPTRRLPSISETQLTKLRMLTLVDLARKTRSLPYCESTSGPGTHILCSRAVLTISQNDLYFFCVLRVSYPSREIIHPRPRRPPDRGHLFGPPRRTHQPEGKGARSGQRHRKGCEVVGTCSGWSWGTEGSTGEDRSGDDAGPHDVVRKGGRHAAESRLSNRWYQKARVSSCYPLVVVVYWKEDGADGYRFPFFRAYNAQMAGQNSERISTTLVDVAKASVAR